LPRLRGCSRIRGAKRKRERIMDIRFFNIAIPVATAALGYLVGFWTQKWKAMEARRAEIERLRRPIYAETLSVLCALEQGQYQSDRLASGIVRLQDWAISKSTDMPPQGNALLLGVIDSARALWAASQNNNPEIAVKVNKVFNENLQKVKTFFIDNEAIRWLPEDRDKK
jgi:hypothetical protein